MTGFRGGEGGDVKLMELNSTSYIDAGSSSIVWVCHIVSTIGPPSTFLFL